MEASKHEWADLLMKYLRRDITPEELTELERQKACSPVKQAQFKACTDKRQFMERMRVQSNADVKAGWKALRKRVPALKQASNPFLKQPAIKWAAAAIVIAGLFTWGYFYFERPGKQETKDALALTPTRRPHRAPLYPYMVLPGGDTVNLRHVPDSLLKEGTGWALHKNGKGILFHKNQAGIEAPSIEATSKAYYTVYNPTGEPYEVQLPDGSDVVLNAASSLKIPALFGITERQVTASGEAFFHVSKNRRRPFRVIIDTSTQVEVLGTTFNISAYEEDPQKISLLTGGVKVIKNNRSVVLHAGQQALVDDNEPIQVVNMRESENAIAWTQGVFEFDSLDIRSIMRELARRYEVRVRFEGDFSSKPPAGRYSRDLPLTEILKDLNKLNHINAQLKEDELVVKGH